jgi:Amidohydrolase family
MTNPGTVVLRGVTVVGTRDGSLTPDVDITITGGTIRAIEPAKPECPAASIDARGKYVTPGFLDMHAHPLALKDPAGSLELMLATGITGFRQMSGSPRLLQQRASGTLPMPQDSPALLAMPGSLLTPLNAGTRQAAAGTVTEQHAAGADFVKVAMIAPDVFFAAQRQAARLGIPILGHLPVNIDVIAASQGGMKSIEHLGPGLGILAACSADEPRIRTTLAARRQPKAPPVKVPFMDHIMGRLVRKLVVNPVARSSAADVALLRRAIDTFDEDKCRTLAGRFRADGTWQTPTLIRGRTSEICDASEYRTDPNLGYVDPRAVRTWQAAGAAFAQRPVQQKSTFRDLYALQQRLTKLFDDAGVAMMAGSDTCGAAWVIPGYSLHQEFDELAGAGLSPLRVLQMATLNGAEFLGTTATMGTVEPGKNADLVLLDANPIDDVKHLHTVSAVVRAGRYYSPAALQDIKTKVATSRSVS